MGFLLPSTPTFVLMHKARKTEDCFTQGTHRKRATLTMVAMYALRPKLLVNFFLK